MPYAAAVPINVASREEEIASKRELRSDAQVSGDLNSSVYHIRLKPVKFAVLLDALNEKRISVRIGM
jgi:hypothetical protein